MPFYCYTMEKSIKRYCLRGTLDPDTIVGILYAPFNASRLSRVKVKYTVGNKGRERKNANNNNNINKSNNISSFIAEIRVAKTNE